jgi:hypothetical protein
MRAWLITWDWVGDHAAVANPIVDILSARTSLKEIRTHVARLYAREQLSWSERLELVRYANREALIRMSRAAVADDCMLIAVITRS